MKPAGSARPASAGSVLLEMLAALACTSVLAGAVLSLLADTARVCQDRRGRIEARFQASAAADLLARELERAGHGLEGAAIRLGGETVPALELREGGFAVAYAEGLAIGVRDEGEARYGIAGTASGMAIAVGDDVAVLGAVGAPQVGRVLEIERREAGDRLTVDWFGAAPPEIRALVMVRRREIGLVPTEGLWQLRQRAAGGRWQPAVDGLADVQLRYAAEGDGDGRLDTWEVSPPPDRLPRAIHVRVVARLATGTTESAERWVRR